MEASQILQVSLLEILFDGKNKAYGAYHLRKTYNKRIAIALLTMSATMLAFIAALLISEHFKKDNAIIPVTVPESVLQKMKEEEIKVSSSPKLRKKTVATIKFPPPIIAKDPPVKGPTPDIKQLEAAKIDLETVDGTKENIDIITPAEDIEGSNVIATPVSKKTAGDKPFRTVQIDAQFPGGAEAWQRYIRKAIMSKMDQFSDVDFGTCIIEFIVDKNGNVSDVKATTMAGTKLAEIATNTIRKGPNWIPAIQNGHYVNAYRIQPVTLNNLEQ